MQTLPFFAVRPCLSLFSGQNTPYQSVYFYEKEKELKNKMPFVYIIKCNHGIYCYLFLFFALCFLTFPLLANQRFTSINVELCASNVPAHICNQVREGKGGRRRRTEKGGGRERGSGKVENFSAF